MELTNYNPLLLLLLLLLGCLTSCCDSTNNSQQQQQRARIASRRAKHVGPQSPQQPDGASIQDPIDPNGPLLRSHYNNSIANNNSTTSSYYLAQASIVPLTTIFDYRKAQHCVAAPQSFNFCHEHLGWSPYVGVPNLLGEKSGDALDMYARSLRLNELVSVKCRKNQQLKVLLCAVLAPPCLDLIVPPCRRLCQIAKASCEPAMRRQGLAWPKFLDCNHFPRGQDSCLDKQPTLIAPPTIEPQLYAPSTQPPELVEPSTTQMTTTTTTAISTTTTSTTTTPSVAHKPRPHKTKSKKYKNRSTTTTTTTTTSTTTTPAPLIPEATTVASDN